MTGWRSAHGSTLPSTDKVFEAQVKLTADFLNRLGVSSFVVGLFAPLAALLFEQAVVANVTVLIGSAGFLAIGLTLHIWALSVREKLRPQQGEGHARSMARPLE